MSQAQTKGVIPASVIIIIPAIVAESNKKIAKGSFPSFTAYI